MSDVENFLLWLYSCFHFPTGQIIIPDEITFQLEDADTPVFNLTCTSTGGPVSTVSWRRDGTILSDDSNYTITSEVTDGTTSTYAHTVTVTGRLLGEYQCNVSGIRTPSGSRRSLTVGKRPEFSRKLSREETFSKFQGFIKSCKSFLRKSFSSKFGRHGVLWNQFVNWSSSF